MISISLLRNTMFAFVSSLFSFRFFLCSFQYLVHNKICSCLLYFSLRMITFSYFFTYPITLVPSWTLLFVLVYSSRMNNLLCVTFNLPEFCLVHALQSQDGFLTLAKLFSIFHDKDRVYTQK
jgi:hypothetical protein